LSADIAHTRHAQHKERHVVTLRYEARAEREARDTRTGLAAEPLVIIKIRDISLNYGLFLNAVLSQYIYSQDNIRSCEKLQQTNIKTLKLPVNRS